MVDRASLIGWLFSLPVSLSQLGPGPVARVNVGFVAYKGEAEEAAPPRWNHGGCGACG